MRAFSAESWACRRAREAISMRLDGELSELEEAVLDAHLARCVECTAFGADVAAATEELRAASQETLTRPLELPLRRGGRFGAARATVWVAGAAAAAAALLAVTVLPENRVEAPPSIRPVPTSNQDLRDLRVLRKAQMKPAGLILSAPPRGAEL
jgi:anti-sigma factor RsiW